MAQTSIFGAVLQGVAAVLLATQPWICPAIVSACPATMQEMQDFHTQLLTKKQSMLRHYAKEWKTTKSTKTAFFLAMLKQDDPETSAKLYAKVLKGFPDCVHAGMHRGKALLQRTAHTAAEEHFDRTFKSWADRIKIPPDFFQDYHEATRAAAFARPGGPGNVSAARWRNIITWPRLPEDERCYFAASAAQVYAEYPGSFGGRGAAEARRETSLVVPRSACGDLPGCEESYELQGQVLQLGDQLSSHCDLGWRLLGTLSINEGDVETGFRYYQKNVESMRHIDASPERSLSRKNHLSSTGRVASRQQLDHDADQLEFLVAKGMLPKEKYQTWIEKFRAVSNQLPDGGNVQLTDDTFRAIDPMYGRLHYLADGDRLPKQVLAQRDPSEWAAFETAFATGDVIVIDNLLTEEALHYVRNWAVHSTIYFDAKARGYVGSYSEDGFSAPIIAQIAAELGAALPKATQGQNVTQAWAYKYDNKKNAGIQYHADMALVNCNLWLTPDHANQLKGRGGLDVFKKKVPLEWDFDRYNSDEGLQDMLAFIEDAELVRVPYRENRMVLFNSQYVHKTDDIDFKPGYENRRINLTLLYGDKYTPAEAYALAKANYLDLNTDELWPGSRQEL